jgi:hypothetical protein
MALRSSASAGQRHGAVPVTTRKQDGTASASAVLRFARCASLHLFARGSVVRRARGPIRTPSSSARAARLSMGICDADSLSGVCRARVVGEGKQACGDFCGRSSVLHRGWDYKPRRGGLSCPPVRDAGGALGRPALVPAANNDACGRGNVERRRVPFHELMRCGRHRRRRRCTGAAPLVASTGHRGSMPSRIHATADDARRAIRRFELTRAGGCSTGQVRATRSLYSRVNLNVTRGTRQSASWRRRPLMSLDGRRLRGGGATGTGSSDDPVIHPRREMRRCRPDRARLLGAATGSWLPRREESGGCDERLSLLSLREVFARSRCMPGVSD